MDAEYVRKPSFAVIGFTQVLKPERLETDCPALWEEFRSVRFRELFEGREPSDEVEKAVSGNCVGCYGACISTCNDNVNYMIAGMYNEGEIPEGMKVFRVPESDWAVFSGEGSPHETVREITSRIWNEWYLEEGIACNPCGDAVFEKYDWNGMKDGKCRVEVWVQIMHVPQK